MNSLYTSLEKAREELCSRRFDSTLLRRVEDFLNGHIPAPFECGPKAVSTAHVATPNFSYLEFLSMARKAELPPLFFEYRNDLFVTTNYDKACMAKMVFCRECGRDIISKQVINLDGSLEKTPFHELVTLWGEPFVSFHHRALKTCDLGAELWDGSLWYAAQGGSPRDYYPRILALFICHGILFENYLVNKREAVFTNEIVLPAFEMVTRFFGVQPLIVRIVPEEAAEDKFWWRYPSNIRELIPS